MSSSAVRAGARERGVTPRALELAHRYLARRERTVSEVRRHLLGHDLDEGVVADAIAELTAQGCLDDTRFARLFVEDKRSLEQWGNERIRRGLLVRGIGRELADGALASGDGLERERSELDRALEVLRARFPSPPRGRRERERALGLLLRKGYEPELALEALYAHGHDR